VVISSSVKMKKMDTVPIVACFIAGNDKLIMFDRKFDHRRREIEITGMDVRLRLLGAVERECAEP
jgi:hypothetical protein